MLTQFFSFFSFVYLQLSILQLAKIQPKESFEQPSLMTTITTALGFYFLMLIGFLNTLFFIPNVATEKNREGYATLYDSFEKFYSYYVYRRVKDCWNRPILSVPGDTLILKDRITRDNGWTSEFTGRTIKCVNLGSYNYLGFAKNTGPCAETSIKAIEDYGIATCSARRELGELTYTSNFMCDSDHFGLIDSLIMSSNYVFRVIHDFDNDL